jgi:hypothetical protein
MRKKGPTKIKIKAMDPQKFLAPQKILIVPMAYESLNPGLLLTQAYEMNFVLIKDFFYIFYRNDAKKFGLFKIAISL